MRSTVHDFRASRTLGVLGTCASDLGTALSYLNAAIVRLLMAPEVGDEGWYGSWAKVVFTVDPNNPYIIAPREIARLSAMDVCRQPIRVQNEWFEFLDFGPKLQVQPACGNPSRFCAPMQAYERGVVPFPVDFPTGSKLRFFLSDPSDTLKRVFFKGTDQNGNAITTLDNGRQYNGFFVTLDASQSFVDSVYTLNSLVDFAKDVTLFPVTVYAVNPTSGAQTLLATLAPSQTSGSYRRYFVGGLPQQCGDCDSATGSVQVTALAKLEHVPLTNDTDFLIIGNLEALKEECLSIYYGEMQSSEAETKAARHHKNAIRLLQGELVHYLGKRQPALNYRPFGRASLHNTFIGMT